MAEGNSAIQSTRQDTGYVDDTAHAIREVLSAVLQLDAIKLPCGNNDHCVLLEGGMSRRRV